MVSKFKWAVKVFTVLAGLPLMAVGFVCGYLWRVFFAGVHMCDDFLTWCDE